MIPALLVTLLACVLSGVATPVRYDLRQDGDTNVDGKLENMAVVVMDNDMSVSELVVSKALDFIMELIEQRNSAGESDGVWGDYRDETTEELAEETTVTETTPSTLNQTESGIKKQ